MTDKKKYLFGPVPSRRLGLSLGVDVVPFKVCTLDCVYCQLGRTTEKTIERKSYVPVDAVLAEIKEKVRQGLKADFITISGSGEPTLNFDLGRIIEGIKQITDIPVAVLTNGTLLTESSVRADCARADLVVPSLDAGDEQTFQRINRPYCDISIENVISGLCAFRDEFQGQIWLEVFLVDGINTVAAQIAKIKDAVEKIRPDKVQLNTAVRPTAEPDIKKLDWKRLKIIAGRFGDDCEVVADFYREHHTGQIERDAEDVFSMLKRRPCSLKDLCGGLGLHRNEVLKYLTYLQEQGVVDSVEKNGIIFFKAIG